MGRKKTQFEESLLLNNRTYMMYLERLTELAVSMFEWRNLPDTIDPRYLELHLFEKGAVVYFKDEAVGDLCLDVATQGRLNVYGYPVRRKAYSSYNNYNKQLTDTDSVIIYNNYLRTNSVMQMKLYAQRLYQLDRIIDVNVRAQKTPVLIQADEKQRLTMLNVYKEYDGDSPVIFGDKNLDVKGLKVLSTNAPYVSDKLYTLKTQIWNEALTYLGISNVNYQKKERMITDEVTRNQGGTIASRYSRLQMRREAVNQINKMFGTNIEVNYREDFQEIFESRDDELRGLDTVGGEGNE